MTSPYPIELERLQFARGQTLLGRDLGDPLVEDGERRWWHNRAMHKVFGFYPPPPDVKLTSKKTVAVPRFFGYDCYGHELIWCRDAAEIPLPQEAVKHPEKCSPLLLVACAHPIGPGLVKTCVKWCREEDWFPRDGVPLTRLQALSGSFELDDKFSVPVTRAMSRPRIGSGTTLRHATDWKPADGTKEQDDEDEWHWLQVRVDTSGSGFKNDPIYIASLEGPRVIQAPKERRNPLIIFFDDIVQRSRRDFVFQVIISCPALDDEPALERALMCAEIMNQQGVCVSWIGAEPKQPDAIHCEVFDECH